MFFEVFRGLPFQGFLILSLIATCANDKCVVYGVISVIKFTQALWSCSGWLQTFEMVGKNINDILFCSGVRSKMKRKPRRINHNTV